MSKKPSSPPRKRILPTGGSSTGFVDHGIEYDVIWDERLPDLIDAVDAALKHGWVPQGGIHSNSAAFYQAVTRRVLRNIVEITE